MDEPSDLIAENIRLFLDEASTIGATFILLDVEDPDPDIAGDQFEADIRANLAELATAAGRPETETSPPWCLGCRNPLHRARPPARLFYAHTRHIANSYPICTVCSPAFDDQRYAEDEFIDALVQRLEEGP